MRPQLPFLLSLLLLPVLESFTPNNAYTLRQAIALHKIRITCIANIGSPHYSRPLALTMVNLTKEPLQIKIPNASLFDPEDEKYQTLVVTCGGTFTLKGSESRKMELYAMCIEPHDMAPSDPISYSLGSDADAKLSAVTTLIEQRKWFDITGQEAVWAIANDSPITSIIGPDKNEVEELRKCIADATGRPLPPETAGYEGDYFAQPLTRVEGSIGFYYSDTASISIALFNANNVVVRELFNNPRVAPGEHKVSYAFDNTVFTDSIYYARLICNGEVRIDRKIEL